MYNDIVMCVFINKILICFFIYLFILEIVIKIKYLHKWHFFKLENLLLFFFYFEELIELNCEQRLFKVLTNKYIVLSKTSFQMENLPM